MRLTPNQKEALLNLNSNDSNDSKAIVINVTVAFDLPPDYIYFIKDLGAAGELHGGIDADGKVST